jgi:transposase
LLQTVPGIGTILSLVLLYEIHDIHRFPRVQDFASYCRLVNCRKESGGTRLGTSGKKIGNAHLKWAFSEAAALFLRNNPAGQKYLARLEKKQALPELPWLTTRYREIKYDRRVGSHAGRA